MLAPNIDPVAISLGPLKIHWYGIMYVLGFVALWWLATRRAKRPDSGWKPEEVGDFVFYGMIGVILGGRLGYVLFYNLGYYLKHPLEVFFITQGGMSFHGGLLGVLLAMLYFARKTGRRFFTVADFFAPWAPIGLGLGRLGNFINHELWGKVSDVPWAMVFSTGGPLPRHLVTRSGQPAIASHGAVVPRRTVTPTGAPRRNSGSDSGIRRTSGNSWIRASSERLRRR